MGRRRPDTQNGPATRLISTPDQRLRVFVSSTLSELSSERAAVRDAIRNLRLTPVMSELGARPHPPADLYRAYLEQSDVFIGIYWQSYGWIAPEAAISGIHDELDLSRDLPRLIYVKEPAPSRDPRLSELLEGIRRGGGPTSFRSFETVDDLVELLLDDLTLLVTEEFYSSTVAAPDLSSGTLTFMFADLEGSTPMIERLGEDEYRELLRRYHAIVNAAVMDHGGRTAATEGDGFFCVFADPIDAANAARDILIAMRQGAWPASEQPRCRIGIHTGTATRTMEGYVGLDVHRASRIGSASNGGQILVSSPTSSLLEDHATRNGWRLLDLGAFHLDGIGRDERLIRVDIPELDTVDKSPRARIRPRLNLPSAPRPIVGRVADIRGASEMLLRDAVRLVTITGPGGTGKTRLAIEIASRLESEFPDGVVFVDLSAIRDPARFLPAVGRALGVQESTERGLLEGLETVVGSSRMLLVLDNLEQLLEVASEVGHLLDALPNSKVLATSRSPLRLTWENEYPLPPLPVPPASADAVAIAASDAVALFTERAQSVRPDFELDHVNEKTVAEITRRLDGLPLAIELAAARLRLFPVDVLLERLDDRLALLDKSASDAPERHRTLRAAIQWSHDLLEEPEKVVFRRLSVFSGGWTLNAALAVCQDDDMSDVQVLDTLEELVAKSLVVFSMDAQGRPRYRMLETLREFSLAELGESGEEIEYRSKHLDWCVSLAERVTETLPTPKFPPFLDEVEIERFNLRGGLNWSISTGQRLEQALAICGYLPLFWDIRGYVTEGVSLTRQLVEMTEGDFRERGMALAAQGWLEMLAGEPDRSGSALGAAVQMFRDLEEVEWLCRSLAMQAMTTYNRDDLDAAEQQFEESVTLCNAHGLEWLADSWCVYGLAHIALARNEFPRALELLEEVETSSRERGLAWGVGHANLSLGVLAFMMGDLDQAFDRLSESMMVRMELRDSRGICDCLGMMALLGSVRGDHGLAAIMLGVAEMAREASGQRPVPWLLPLLEQAQMSAQLALEDEYESKLEVGRGLSPAQAMDLLLERMASSESSVPVVA